MRSERISTVLTVAASVALAILASSTYASSQSSSSESLYDLTQPVLEKSQLAVAGGPRFHIIVEILQTNHPESDMRGQVEQFWIAPDKYRRVIKTPNFSQTLIVNGESVSETDSDNYYPYWLYNEITAVFNPVPFVSALKASRITIHEQGMIGAVETCGDVTMRVDRWRVCFYPKGMLHSVFMKGYDATFHDYAAFGSKLVARRIVTDEGGDGQIVAQITSLEPLPAPDPSMFAVATPTPLSDQLRIVHVSEDRFRSLVVGSTDIAWPDPVLGGMAKGGCGAFASADRDGNVREVFSEGCDNANLEEPLRQALLKWKLKHANANGAPVQVAALLGIPFSVNVQAPPPLSLLSDAEARKLATNIVEPSFPKGSAPSGTKVQIRVKVDDDTRLLDFQNTTQVSDKLFFSAVAAVRKWTFTPYMLDGKAVPFEADVVFVVP
ncbi:MAG: hypothetical protein WA823_16855 [Candidatus Acidiferrales bacterium]